MGAGLPGMHPVEACDGAPIFSVFFTWGSKCGLCYTKTGCEHISDVFIHFPHFLNLLSFEEHDMLLFCAVASAKTLFTRDQRRRGACLCQSS